METQCVLCCVPYIEGFFFVVVESPKWKYWAREIIFNRNKVNRINMKENKEKSFESKVGFFLFFER